MTTQIRYSLDRRKVVSGEDEDDYTHVIEVVSSTRDLTEAEEAERAVDHALLRKQFRPLTRRQLFIALHRLGLVTQEEAVAAAATGEVPVAFAQVFSALPRAERADARVTFATFQQAYRTDDLTLMLQSAAGLSDQQVDDIWLTFADR